MSINGVGLAILTVGGVFAWGGLTNRSPLAAIQAAVQGNNPSTVPSASAPSVASAASVSSGGSTGNQAIGQLLAAPYGWNTGQQWTDLVSLWNKESGWSNTADTRVTHSGGDNASSKVFAYGIAQARPATKYSKAGQPPDLGGSSDANAQIAWGLSYIKSRYGSPSAAWAHELANNWY